MINTHPSEYELQLFSSGQKMPEQVNLHIASCEPCLAAVSEYRLLFGSLKDLPPENFGFDLEAMVMQQVPARVKHSMAPWFWIIPAMIGIAGPAALVFRYRALLSGLLAVAEPLMIPLIATTALTFLGLTGMDLLRQYRVKSAMLENNNLSATS